MAISWIQDKNGHNFITYEGASTMSALKTKFNNYDSILARLEDTNGNGKVDIGETIWEKPLAERNAEIENAKRIEDERIAKEDAEKEDVKETKKTAGTCILTGTGGAAAGVIIGAKWGVKLGASSGPVGAVIGAAAGAVVGGLIGLACRWL